MNTTILLDGASNFPNKTLEEYCVACSTACDTALAEWDTVRETPTSSVSHGFVHDNALISMFWTTTFPNPPPQLLHHLDDLFNGENLKKHAMEWDATFHDCTVLGKIHSNTIDTTPSLLVHWQFNAAPLAGRDMVYIVSSKEDTPSSTDTWTKRITYAYASVEDALIQTVTKKDTPVENTGRVRAMNCFPSCDRVTVFKDGTAQLDHLMTTNIGGWVPTVCFNHVFKSALIDANVHESEAMRKYVLKLCGGKDVGECVE